MSTLRIMFCTVAAMALAAIAPTALAQGTARGQVYTKADVERIIKRVETGSDAFRSGVDRRLDNSRLDGTAREDRINAEVRQFETALDALRARFDRSDTWGETREEVGKVLSEARDVERVLVRGRKPVSPGLRDDWRRIVVDLNTLAGIYNLPRV